MPMSWVSSRSVSRRLADSFCQSSRVSSRSSIAVSDPCNPVITAIRFRSSSCRVRCPASTGSIACSLLAATAMAACSCTLSSMSFSSETSPPNLAANARTRASSSFAATCKCSGFKALSPSRVHSACRRCSGSLKRFGSPTAAASPCSTSSRCAVFRCQPLACPSVSTSFGVSARDNPGDFLKGLPSWTIRQIRP